MGLDLRNARWVGEDWKKDLERLKQLQQTEMLSNIEKQERFVLERHLYPVPCPLCQTRVGAKDIEIECPVCGIKLERCVPFVKVTEPGWHWEITDGARQRLLELWTMYKMRGTKDEDRAGEEPRR